jgi:hypothetical protein
MTPCQKLDDFDICSRWIPPSAFVPIALPINTTYIEVDSCEYRDDGSAFCHEENPKPERVYGNKFIFPSSFDVSKSNYSVCTSNGEYFSNMFDATTSQTIIKGTV